MIDMSYFGVSGPAQDGGFIAGIGAGTQRLNNARAARANYSKTLAGRVSRGLGSAITFNEKKLPLSEFLTKYGSYIKWSRSSFLLRILDKEQTPYNEYYVGIQDINALKVQALLDDYIERERTRIALENEGQSQDNIDIYVLTEAKREYKEVYKELFEAAGYDEDDALVLAQSAVNLHKDTIWGRVPLKTKEAVYTHILDPSEKEATAEYVVNQGRPQNTTQYAVYGVGLVAIAVLYLSRRQFRGTKARQGAFYGVFS